MKSECESSFLVQTFAVNVGLMKYRSMVFLLLGAVTMIGGFLGTYLSVSIDYSIAILLGLVMYSITICVAAFTPDTLAGGSSTVKNDLFLSEISYLIDIRKVLHEVARVARLVCRDNKQIGAILLALLFAAHLGVSPHAHCQSLVLNKETYQYGSSGKNGIISQSIPSIISILDYTGPSLGPDTMLQITPFKRFMDGANRCSDFSPGSPASCLFRRECPAV